MKKVLTVLVLALAVTPFAAMAEPFGVYQSSPARGTVLHAGDVVTLAWKVTLPDDWVLTGCEQEVFLSVDGGLTNALRLTQMLSPNVRQISWTVPNMKVKQAVLDIRFGCAENDETNNFSLPFYPQMGSTFKIRKAHNQQLEGVLIGDLAQNTVSAGGVVNLSWTSSVRNVDHFEVLTSFDGGSHFFPAGRATGNSFEWKAPAKLYGGVTFQVVAHRTDGSTVSSLIPAKQHLLVASN